MKTDWQDKLKGTLDHNSLALIEGRFIRTTQSQTDVAKWMLDEWMPIELVATVTGLPLNHVVSLELEMGSDDMGAYDVCPCNTRSGGEVPVS
ncbi:hypothetical protein ACTEUO_004728, partial [Vibrio vulnificus]